MKEKIKVLIADDNMEFAITLNGYLENEDDMEVVGMARDGNEAYDMILEKQPDVVLLDVIMPHLDGLGVLEKLNSSSLNKLPLCIMLSAVGQDKITQKAISLGAEYYIVKPFDISLLMKRIQEFKYYEPGAVKGNYAAREIKQQYIEIAPENKKDESFKVLPDLILIDGGKSHVLAVEEIFKEKNFNVPFFGLVKDNNHKTRAIVSKEGLI